MKFSLSILIAMCSALLSFGQHQKLFDVEEVILTDTIEQKKIANLLKEKPVLFEDEKYVVRRTCSGEWGGSVYFRNKITKVERSCSATCAVTILKAENKYLVVNSLAHMSGFTSVVEVKNPELLTVFKLPSPRSKNGKKQIRYVGDDESKSLKGTKTLVDTIGITTLAAFAYQKQPFYIISGNEGTYVAKIENKHFVNIDKISDKRIWTYETMLTKPNGNFQALFTGFKSGGYIDVAKNHIKIVYFK
ncbi:hypothetical protein [Mucilaginibacter aquatilis]|uniref:Uncharacterized protein n=1 Tax=Mucilaginibacter aquatilis TaxID=1517760 RepID=A0A6I4IGV8_9SPHI|nr:hypothetical protein [Mucilaginibacter aquatilis]MVN92838.1 hypothetical protein [Mucilaginibacter aquatilis]